MKTDPLATLKFSEKPYAVVVGLEENGLGVVRSLASQGIPSIALVGPFRNPACFTSKTHCVNSSEWSPRGVIHDLKIIASRLPGKVPLLITKDEPVLWISEAREELLDSYELYLPSKNTVHQLMSKPEFLKLASDEGWPVPRSWKFFHRDELLASLNDIPFPSILKPQIKNSEFRMFCSQKAYKVQNKNELLQVYDTVAQWEKEIIVQEWILGGDERIAFCLTYYDKQGSPLALFPGRKLRQWPIRYGSTMMSEPAPEKWREPIVQLTKAIWEKVGFTGIGSIEYKMQEGSDRPLVIEPTIGRTDYQSELAVLNGVNIPAIAYSDLLGLPNQQVSSVSVPVKLIDGMGEMQSAIQYIRLGELSMTQWMKDRLGKKGYMILRSNDLGPFLATLVRSFRSFLGSVLDMVLGKHLKKKLLASFRTFRYGGSVGR